MVLRTLLLSFLSLLGPLLLASPAATQTDEQKLDAVKEFRRYFRKFREVSQKVEAVHTLRGNECVPAAMELVKLLDADEPEIRAAAMEVLETYRSPATFAALVEEVADMKDQERRAVLIGVLGRSRVRAAVDVLRRIALEDKRASESVLVAIARALARIGEPKVEDVLRRLLADRSARVRMAAADAVAALRVKEVGAELVPLLHDKAWQVRSAAIAAVAAVRPQQAVEPLIELMREGGRLKTECADALFAITSLDFGADAEEWARQWQRLRSIGWRIPTDEEVAKAKASRKRSDSFYGKKEETTTFHGVTTTSTRVLFIIDVSGSMDDEVVQREKFAGAGYSDFKKLTIVKQELLRTIDSLSANTYFNIVAFATKVKPWKKFLVPANIVNKSSAKAWVRRLRPIGGSEAQELAAAGLSGSANLAAGKTNTFAALMYPFGIDPEKPVRSAKTLGRASIKNKLDTVFFLSDGRPSTGKVVDEVEILEEVTRVNQDFKIVFHCIAIGDFQKNFLRSLAERNGGVFVDLGR